MKTLALACLIAFIFPDTAPAADTAPDRLSQSGTAQRTATGNTLSSSADPAVEITLPASVSMVGSDNWVIKQYADQVALFAFVDADKAKTVQQLYWLQFEAYLSPDLKHSYDSKRHVTLGGMDFIVDSWVEELSAADDPDSDSAHLKALLKAKGYALPAAMMSVRFVHLMDGDRKELMYIYSEPIPKDYTVGELREGGTDHFLWNLIEKALIERAEQSIQLH